MKLQNEEFLKKVAQFIYDTTPNAFKLVDDVWEDEQPAILYRDRFIAVIREDILYGGYRTNLVILDWTSDEEDKIRYIIVEYDFLVQVIAHRESPEYEFWQKEGDQ